MKLKNNFYMDAHLSTDEIIDKYAFNIKIYKHARLIDPAFIMDFEMFAIGMANDHPALWWTVIKEKTIEGTVYVFESKKDLEKFKGLNTSFINKINFII